MDAVSDLNKGDIIGYGLDKDGYINHAAVYLGSEGELAFGV